MTDAVMPTPSPNTLGKHTAIPAKIRCLNPKYATGVGAQRVASYSKESRDEVTDERVVTVFNGRHGLPALDIKRASVAELARAREMLQRRGYSLVRYSSSVPHDAVALIQNPAKARDDGHEDRPGEVPGAKQRYMRELESLVCNMTGASYCVMTAWSIRDGAKRAGAAERDVGFVGAYSFFSHSDFTPAMGAAGWKMLLKRMPGMTEQHAKRMRYSFMNVWKPTNHEVEQFPLAVLDWQTVNPADCHEVELGYALTPSSKAEKGVEEGEQGYHSKDTSYGERNKADVTIAGFYKPRLAQVVHRLEHAWVYFPKMQLDELLIFTHYDQRFDEANPRRFAKHTFHTAFWDPSAPDPAQRRQSIEIRLLCAFEDGSRQGEDNQPATSKL